MTVSLRLDREDAELIKAYADMNGISVSELLRRSVLEHIEEQHDLRAYEQAIKEYRKDPVTYSHDEVIKMLNEE